jgi:hypothetical protein
LNGHEYVACQARKVGITFTKEGNCFTTISDAAGLAKIADTLSEQRAIGRLSQVCERWIYDCVCMDQVFQALIDRSRAGSAPLHPPYRLYYSTVAREIGPVNGRHPRRLNSLGRVNRPPRQRVRPRGRHCERPRRN